MDYHKAICIASGGMDSATLLYDMKEKYEIVHVLSFNYNQRHKRELLYAKTLCKKLGVVHEIMDLTPVTACLRSGSLTTNAKVPFGHYEAPTMKQTVVPNRNSIMLNLAIGRAISLEYGVVGYGAHAGDHSIYPDCRPVFVEKLQELAKVVDYHPIQIYAPFINITKTEVVKKGLELKIPYETTWSCYNGKTRPCLKCGTCQERTIAFRDNNTKDPLLTEDEWKTALSIVEGVK